MYDQTVEVSVTTMWPKRLSTLQVRVLSPPLKITNPQSKMETLVETESNIIGSIREMCIGDEIEFPLSKAPYIRNAIAQRLMPERQAGCRWSTVASVEEGTIVVKRIA